MKPILHFQIPLGEDSRCKDNLLVDPETMGKFLQLVIKTLGDDFSIIATPCIPTMTDGVSLINFDMKQIGVDELVSLLKLKQGS